MMALVDRALALNPSFAWGCRVSGVLRLWAGQPDIAIEHFERALRLSPRTRGVSFALIGRAHFFARRLDEAVPKLLLAIQDDPSFAQAYRTLAACYAHMGRLDDARAIVERRRAITSVVIPVPASCGTLSTGSSSCRACVGGRRAKVSQTSLLAGFPVRSSQRGSATRRCGGAHGVLRPVPSPDGARREGFRGSRRLPRRGPPS
jgi:hypothetical protein